MSGRGTYLSFGRLGSCPGPILSYTRGVRITCPICKTVLENAPDDFEPRPFCSPRCKLVDLGNWLSDSYRIPTSERPEDTDDPFGPS